jgi:hypothetical protein
MITMNKKSGVGKPVLRWQFSKPFLLQGWMQRAAGF